MASKIIESNGCYPQLANDLKDRIDSLIAELQEMRDNLGQCACGEDESMDAADDPKGEHEVSTSE